MNGPTWNLDDNRKTVTVTFPTDPPVQLKLDAERIDNMLANLGEFRAHMKPPVDHDWALGQKASAIRDPRWVSEADVMEGNSLLHIRDPRYGWLHYLFPRNEAARLGNLLKTQSELPPPGQPQGRPN